MFGSAGSSVSAESSASSSAASIPDEDDEGAFTRSVFSPISSGNENNTLSPSFLGEIDSKLLAIKEKFAQATSALRCGIQEDPTDHRLSPVSVALSSCTSSEDEDTASNEDVALSTVSLVNVDSTSLPVDDEVSLVSSLQITSVASDYWGQFTLDSYFMHGYHEGFDDDEYDEDMAPIVSTVLANHVTSTYTTEVTGRIDNTRLLQTDLSSLAIAEEAPTTNYEEEKLRESVSHWTGATFVPSAKSQRERKKVLALVKRNLQPVMNYLCPLTYYIPTAYEQEHGLTESKSFSDYVVPEELVPVFNSNMELTFLSTPNDQVVIERIGKLRSASGSFEPFNYREFRSLMLYAEEYSQEVELSKFKMYSAVLRRVGKQEVMVYIPGLADKCPNLLKGDIAIAEKGGRVFTLCLSDAFNNEAVYTSRTLCEAFFTGRAFYKNGIAETVTCNLTFTVNQHMFRLQHSALNYIHDALLETLYPSEDLPEEKQLVPKTTEIQNMDLFNENIRNNKEQLLAIYQIQQLPSHPHPFILFGPPGTGKTMTIVEAIKQVWLNSEDARILVTAPSNTACDLLASLLLNDIPTEDIFRLYAPTREGLPIPEELDEIAKYGQLPLKKLLTVKIIVTTLATAARLFHKKKDPGFYTHVFVDEAGQATETEVLIALARLVTGPTAKRCKLHPSARIILSGDPCQLGPVVISRIAMKLGFGMSIIERLISHPLYLKDENGERDPHYIVKLVRNYRSHSKLLKVPSQLFYDNELVPCADPESSKRFLSRLTWLPRNDFPILFHGVHSPHAKSDNMPSLHNEKELAWIEYYLMRLQSSCVRPREIGIVSPYRRQVHLIKNILERKSLPGVLVGSTEEFQGQEREVMILSTVRSSLGNAELVNDWKQRGTLGFLTNEKRFNVAITRAKSCMILIGDPVLLVRDKNWRKLIQYIKQNGGYTGVPFELNPRAR